MAKRTYSMDKDGVPYYNKAVSEKLDYHVEWISWLEGATILTTSWTVPAGLTVDSDYAATVSKSSVIVSGGTAGSKYDMVATITTSDSTTKTQTIRIKVK